MAKAGNKTAFGGIAPALIAAAGLAFAVPTASLALGLGMGGAKAGGDTSPVAALANMDFAPFTPATVDPELALRVAASVRAKGQAIRFTPATGHSSQARTYTVAVRVDDETARAISVRSAIASAQRDAGTRTVSLAPTRYNLGAARGYQGFAKTSAAPSRPLVSATLRDVSLPDLADFKPSEGTARDKPSRFQPRIALETEKGTAGRSRGTLESLGEQSVDLGGAYRVTRNLDVTAGVRLSQDRDRLAPLTDAVQDSQAVYVGTQFRF